MSTTKRMGRPRIVQGETLSRILDLIRRGYSCDDAARAVGVSDDTFRRARRSDRRIDEAARAARSLFKTAKVR